jgi:hypothetical protein
MNRESFLALTDKPVKVDVPEWDAEVWLRPMSSDERFAWVKATAGLGDDARIVHALLVRCLCDETGARLLTDEDVAALGKKNGDVIDRLGEKALQINGMGKSAQEDIAKNSETGQT